MKKQLNIDFVSYLNDKGERIFTSGKNVKSGEVNIRCWNCGDKSNHLRIKPHGYFECWKNCGNKGWFYGIIQHLDNCDFKTALQIAKKYETSEPIVIKPQKEIAHKTLENFSLPRGVNPYLHKIHRNYLIDRGFDPDELTYKYNLHSCLWENQYWKYRIIIPIILNGKVVSWIGRDVTGKQEPRYKDAREENVIIPKRDSLYNFDSVEEGGVGLLSEGPTDVWNFGDGGFASMSTNFTMAQINLIRKKKLKRLFTCFDNPKCDPLVPEKIEKLEKYLHFIPELCNIDLGDAEDLGCLPKDDVRHLRMEIFGRV